MCHNIIYRIVVMITSTFSNNQEQLYRQVVMLHVDCFTKLNKQARKSRRASVLNLLVEQAFTSSSARIPGLNSGWRFCKVGCCCCQFSVRKAVERELSVHRQNIYSTVSCNSCLLYSLFTAGTTIPKKERAIYTFGTTTCLRCAL
jgi:hypothetical protein